jgi:chemotaxis protein CheD
VIFVVQGTYAVSSKADEVIQTLLGSCVATCMHDPVAKIGGLNHFLLPGDSQATSNTLSYGTHAMEMLINSLMRLGARRERLQAKLFGGARMMTSGKDIGVQNGEFAKRFLERERILCTSVSLGGLQARKIRMYPTTGAVQQMFVGEATIVPVAPPPPTKVAGGGELELF